MAIKKPTGSSNFNPCSMIVKSVLDCSLSHVEKNKCKNCLISAKGTHTTHQIKYRITVNVAFKVLQLYERIPLMCPLPFMMCVGYSLPASIIC